MANKQSHVNVTQSGDYRIISGTGAQRGFTRSIPSPYSTGTQNPLKKRRFGGKPASCILRNISLSFS